MSFLARRIPQRGTGLIHAVSLLLAAGVFLFTGLPDLAQYFRHPARIAVDDLELHNRRKEHFKLMWKERLCRLEIRDNSTEIDPDTSQCAPAPSLDTLRDPTPKELAFRLLDLQRLWRVLWPTAVTWSGGWLVFAAYLARRSPSS